MNSVERVKKLCKEKKIPISKLEKDLGFANGYVGQLRKGTFPDDRIGKIASYLGVSTHYLMTGHEEDKLIDLNDEINKLLYSLTGDGNVYFSGEEMTDEGKLALLNSLKQDLEFLNAMYIADKKEG